MQTVQVMIVSIAFSYAFLNWWEPGFKRYALLGTLPDLPTILTVDRADAGVKP
ncbi:MAG: hypothetical protein AAF821_18085 [Cyanobacteria bacterium P01_D01_bin.156]